MKKSILVIAIVIGSQSIKAQQSFDDTCQKIAAIDQLIHKVDTDPNGTKAYENDPLYKRLVSDSMVVYVDKTRKTFTEIHNRIIGIVDLYLIPLLTVGKENYSHEKFKSYLDCIKTTETITWLEYVVEQMVDKGKLHYSSINESPTILKEAHSLIRKRIDQIMGKEFSFYRFTETSKKPVKAIYVEHTNDFFSAPKYNDDRDLTGAFRFEFFTDWLKMRLFSSYRDKWWHMNSRSWYTYQSFFIGGEGYTPYLRDTSIFKADTSFDPNDRPYASFKYFGRAKYRIFRNGKYKIFSQVKFGTIGSSAPNSIQSRIHRDLTVGSVTPKGWGAQIASGGRLAFSYEFSHEFLFLSKNWLISKALTRKTEYSGCKDFNASIFNEIKVGHDMTSVGIGFNIGTKNFKETGGINLPFLDEKILGFGEFLKRNIFFNYKFLYRRVIHNSMLEGYGIFKQEIDEDPASPVDRWILKGHQVNRNVQIHEFSLNFRFRYCGLILKQNFMSPEYNLPVNSMIYPNGVGVGAGSHNRSAWNHVGTIGLLFKIAD
jgi:Uncharacterized protein conserved in bacteria (DUF2219)